MGTSPSSRFLLRMKETKPREGKEGLESTTPTEKPAVSAAIPDSSHNAAFPSSYKNTVLLHDWWLCKAEKDYDGKRLAIGGMVIRGGAVRVFNSAPIIERYDAYTLETADNIIIMISGLINQSRMHQNGFPPEACNHFLMGFPYYWDNYAYNCFGKEFMANSIHTSTSSDDGLPDPSAKSSDFSFPMHSETFTTSRILHLVSPIHGFSGDSDGKVSFLNSLRNFNKHVEKTPSKVTHSEIKSCRLLVVGSLDETPSKYEKSKGDQQHENRKDVATSMAHVNVDTTASYNEEARNESTFVSGEAHREKSELNKLKDIANDASHGSSLQTNTQFGSLMEPMTGMQAETISANIRSTVKANQTDDIPRDKYFMEVSESGDDDASHHSSVQPNTGIVCLSEMISEVPKGTLLRGIRDPEGDNQTDDIPAEKSLMEGSEESNTYASGELNSSKSNTEFCKRINKNFSKSESTKSSSTPISKDHVDVNSDEREPRCYKNVNAENVSISGLVEKSVSNKTKEVYLKFPEEIRSCNCDAVDDSSLKSSMERPEIIMSGLMKDTLLTCIRDSAKEGQTIDVPGEKSYAGRSEYSKIDASEKLKNSKWNHLCCRRTTRSFSKSKSSKSSDISVYKDSVCVKHDESEPRCHKNPNAKIAGVTGVVKTYFSKETYEMHPKTPEAIKSFKFDFGDNSSMQIPCTKSPEVSKYDAFCDPSLQLNTKILNLHERTTGMQKETQFTGTRSLAIDERVENFHIDSSHDLHTNLKNDELPGAMSEALKKTLFTSARDLVKNQKNEIRGGKSYMGRSENSRTDASEKLKRSTSGSKTNWVCCRRITRSLSKSWSLSSSISKDSVGVIHHVGEPQNHKNSNAFIAGFAGLSTESLSNVTNEENNGKSKHNTVNGPSQETGLRVDEMITSLSEMGSGILRGTAEQHAATRSSELASLICNSKEKRKSTGTSTSNADEELPSMERSDSLPKDAKISASVADKLNSFSGKKRHGSCLPSRFSRSLCSAEFSAASSKQTAGLFQEISTMSEALISHSRLKNLQNCEKDDQSIENSKNGAGFVTMARALDLAEDGIEEHLLDSSAKERNSECGLQSSSFSSPPTTDDVLNHSGTGTGDQEISRFSVGCSTSQTRESDVLPMMPPSNDKAFSPSGKWKRGRPKIIPHVSQSPITRLRAKTMSFASPESLNFRRSKSGRLLVPKLYNWYQQIVYDPDGAIAGITSTVDAVTPCTGSKSERPRKKKKLR